MENTYKINNRTDFYDDAHAYMYVFSNKLEGYTRLVCSCPLVCLEQLNAYEGICEKHGLVGPGKPIKLQHLHRSLTRQRNLGKQNDSKLNFEQERKVRRNCFRTFLNRQQAHDLKKDKLNAQMGLVDWFTGNTGPSLSDKLGDTLEHVNDFTMNASNFIESTRRAAENMRTETGAAIEQIEDKVTNFLTNIPTQVDKFLSTEINLGIIKPTVRNLLIALAVATGLYVFNSLYKQISIFYKTILTVVASIISIPLEIINYIFSYIRDINLKAHLGKEEENFDILTFVNSHLPKLAPLLGTIITAIILNKLPGKPATPDILLRRCRDLPGACKGLSEVHTYFSKYWECIFAYVKEQINGPDPLDASKGFPEIERWMNSVLYYSRPEVFREKKNDQTEAFNIMQLWYTGMNILTTYRKVLDRSVVANINDLMKVCAKMKDDISHSGIWNSGPRMEPQMVWLTGGSGVGKSSMIYYLAAHILKPLGLANKVKEAVYLRTVEQEYWDGYRGQPLVAVDDAFQMKDGASSPNVEFMEAIRMSNMFPLNLHMADLSEKATTMFNGKCILYTTNNRSPAIESITYPEAFYRRFTHCYEVQIKPEYQMKRVDSSGRETITLNAKLAKERAPINEDGTRSPINLDVYEFVEFDPWAMRGKPIPVTANKIDFTTLANILQQDMENRVTKSDVLLDDVQKYCEKLHAQVGSLSWIEGKPFWRRQESFEDTQEEIDQMDDLMHFAQYPPHPEIPATDEEVELMKYEWADREIPFTINAIILETKPFITPLLKYALMYREKDAKPDTIYHVLTNAYVGKHKTIVQRVKDAYNTVVNADWTKFFVYVTTFLANPPWWFVLTAAGAITAIVMWVRQNNKKKNRRYRNVDKLVESHQPDTQPRMVTTRLVHESFHPDTQPRVVRQSKVVESHNPDTQPIVTRSTKVVETAVDMFEGGDLRECFAQGCVDQNQVQMLAVVSRQQYQIVGIYEDRTVCFGNGIVVKGRIMLTIQHFVTYMAYHKPDLIVLRNAFLPKGIEIETNDFLKRVVEVEEKQDLILVDLTTLIPAAKDITRHFITRDDLHKLTSFRTVLSGYRNLGSNTVVLHASTGEGEASTAIKYSMEEPNGSIVQVHCVRNIAYDIDTAPGDCGMIASTSHSSIRNKILGLHVAGGNKQRFSNHASLVTTETLNEIIVKHFSLTAQIAQPFEEVGSFIEGVDQLTDLPFKGEFLPIGKIQTQGESLNTRIKPSTIFGKLSEMEINGRKAHEVWNEKHGEDFLLKATDQPFLKQPAKLRRFRNSEGILIDPLLKGIEKAGLPAKTCRTDYLEIAAQAVASKLYFDKAGTKRPKSLLTYEQAIQGISSKEGINGISRTTSPGWPWSTKPHKGKGKTHWMGYYEWDFTSEGALELRKFVDEQEDKIRTGKRLDVAWIDTLKDEILPKAKVDIGKTRVFSNGPMDYTILFRKYFMNFMAHVMDNRIFNEVAVGIDPNSYEWELIAQKVTSKGPKVFDGDFAQYDGTLVAKILWKILDLINEWYDDGEINKLARHVLWNDIVNSVHSCRGILYQWTHSIPSGCPITAIVNSIYNSISMRVVYLEMSPNKSMQYFEDNVAMLSYGDDNIVNISDDISLIFNQIIASEGYSRLGMTYTDADKESELQPYKSLDKISFLKRYWRQDKYLGFYGAPSTLSSRLDILNWTREDNATCALANENQTVASVARELAILGEEVFNFWTPLIRKAYANAGKPMPIIESYVHYMQPMSVM